MLCMFLSIRSVSFNKCWMSIFLSWLSGIDLLLCLFIVSNGRMWTSWVLFWRHSMSSIWSLMASMDETSTWRFLVMSQSWGDEVRYPSGSAVEDVWALQSNNFFSYLQCLSTLLCEVLSVPIPPTVLCPGPTFKIIIETYTRNISTARYSGITIFFSKSKRVFRLGCFPFIDWCLVGSKAEPFITLILFILPPLLEQFISNLVVVMRLWLCMHVTIVQSYVEVCLVILSKYLKLDDWLGAINKLKGTDRYGFYQTLFPCPDVPSHIKAGQVQGKRVSD